MSNQFYFSFPDRRFVRNFDYQQYLAWRATGGSGSAQETQEIKDEQQTIEAAPQEAESSSSDASTLPKEDLYLPVFSFRRSQHTHDLFLNC